MISITKRSDLSEFINESTKSRVIMSFLQGTLLSFTIDFQELIDLVRYAIYVIGWYL